MGKERRMKTGRWRDASAAKAKVEEKAAAVVALVGQCRQQFSSMEEMKLKCGDVQFDGSDPNLPPM